MRHIRMITCVTAVTMSTLLIADKLNKKYGRQVVLEDITATIHGRDRIGLIGRNGAGKTTLLKILSGDDEADTGTVSLMRETRLGTIDQHERLDADPSWVTALAYLSHASGRPEWECRRLAAKFGVRAEHLEKDPMLLSGGFQMRLKLIRMLLVEPNLLLLDEPVNYLDLPTLIHLERFLARWRGALIITSHDRELLQNLCDITWDIAYGSLTKFSGTVETYLAWVVEQQEYARRTNKKMRKKISHAQDFVDRFRYKASKASQAQDRLKLIARLRSTLSELPTTTASAAFRLECPPYVKGTAVECTGLTIGYPNAEAVDDPIRVARDIDLHFNRGQKIGVVGENGQGKTTLLRTLGGRIDPVEGKVKWWSKADIGYFSQDSEETLDPKRSVLDTLTASSDSEVSAERILATAGAFLFRDDALEKPCSVLSGGERSRLRLACLTLRRHNVLLLDEPTNHLDVETVEVLARAIKEYEGTVMVVSHARTFMSAVADELVVVSAAGVKRYMGTYEEYVTDLIADAESDAGGDSADMSTKKEETSIRRALHQAKRQRQRKQKRLMDEMSPLEKEKGEIMRFFFENPTDYDTGKQRRLSEIEEQIDALEKEWLKLEEESARDDV